jgi:glycosyltransferase involved in cell wall biosynthesis
MNYPARLALVQRVLPAYRVPFFDALAQACSGGLHLFAGQALPGEGITSGAPQIAHHTHAHNRHIFHPAHPLFACIQTNLMHWLEQTDPAALIIEANFRYLASPLAVQWMHARKRPVLGWGLGAPGGGAFAPIRNQFLRQFDGIISYSARGAQQYISVGCRADKVFIAPNAVAPAPKHPLPPRVDSFALQPVALFVGRLQARKRIPSLLKACAALPEQLQPRLIIIGDGPEREPLQALAESIYPHAEFRGEQRGEPLAEAFRAADVFVLPGTGGLAVQEAMSYGLPVIVAQGDGTQDDLVRPQNGWQIAPDDDFALMFALQEALSNAPRLRQMGAESYRIVAEEINLEKMVGVFVDAIEKSRAR